MPLRHFQRQYEQLSQIESGRIMGMMEALWSARTPSKDQSSKRPPHRKKFTLTDNCFIGRHPVTDDTFIRGPCVLSNHTKALAEGHSGSRRPLRVLALTPPFRVVPRKRKLDYSRMEPGRL
ncbi:uncharacterized protein TNCV_2297821 [Trichonephila clavipes]|nr:uncharacterized protein TNCV_2297821 [Trichonephila clavipes]